MSVCVCMQNSKSFHVKLEKQTKDVDSTWLEFTNLLTIVCFFWYFHFVWWNVFWKKITFLCMFNWNFAQCKHTFCCTIEEWYYTERNENKQSNQQSNRLKNVFVSIEKVRMRGKKEQESVYLRKGLSVRDRIGNNNKQVFCLVFQSIHWTPQSKSKQCFLSVRNAQRNTYSKFYYLI